MASGLLYRNISAATGVSASARPATRPATGPAQRRTVAATRPTAATPASASGTSLLQELKPNTRTDSSITHSASGGLSTVMKLAASKDPKKKAFQLCAPLMTAAE